MKKFTDRKTATMRIWTAAQRLGEALEEEIRIAEQDMLRAQQELLSAPKATKPAKLSRTAAPKATVLALLEREGGAILEEILSATSWQKHSVRGFISMLGSKHGYTVTSVRRETDQTRCYSTTK